MIDFSSLERLGLSDLKNVDLDKSQEIYSSFNNNHIIYLWFYKDSDLTCINCHSSNIEITSSRTNTIKSTSLTSGNLFIKLNRRIYHCNCCKSYFTEPNQINMINRSISFNKDLKILSLLKDVNRSFKSIAHEVGVSTNYVIKVFDQHVDIKPGKLPEILSIDEVYNSKISRYKYCCVLYSPQYNKSIDIIDTRRQDYLTDYFNFISEKQRNKVKFISIDMWFPYKIVAVRCFPKAKICVDSFHVIQQLGHAFNKVRIKIMKKYDNLEKRKRPYFYWLYKKYWKFLLMDTSKTSYFYFVEKRTGEVYSNLQIIDALLSIDKDLEEAYRLKEDYRDFNKAMNIDTAKQDLHDLMTHFLKSKHEEFRKFGSLLKRWFNEIINSFNIVDGHRVSNGKIERLNRDIKTIFRISYGTRNFARTRNRILYICDKNAPIK